ncbi:hypothetical protein BDP81DRAFT_438221 [Colletotrichum phormii]|uniref:Uncharacterized protein n=1 Tax=Colletotrichum phormii TaxID=359342 RepID=A0AAI9ZJ81_9PEZI|nr:uncharacterized protein BDP81DRAFT_438221 [Colletotrichum phormii]KAK1624294.1 hypothetical protein BDP81DRAFT_438221 [Colletotrichum phormii]
MLLKTLAKGLAVGLSWVMLLQLGAGAMDRRGRSVGHAVQTGVARLLLLLVVDVLVVHDVRYSGMRGDDEGRETEGRMKIY